MESSFSSDKFFQLQNLQGLLVSFSSAIVRLIHSFNNLFFCVPDKRLALIAFWQKVLGVVNQTVTDAKVGFGGGMRYLAIFVKFCPSQFRSVNHFASSSVCYSTNLTAQAIGISINSMAIPMAIKGSRKNLSRAFISRLPYVIGSVFLDEDKCRL